MAQHRRARSPDRRRPRGRDLESAQGALSAGRPHQARSRALLPRGRRRRAARRRRPAERARALSERHRRRVLLPEARAGVAARLDRGRRRCSFPSGRTRRGSRAARRGGARVDGQPRLPRAASASGARRRSRSSRRAARRSRSGARRRVATGPRGRAAWCARRSTTSGSSAGRRRRARAACTSTCASSGAGRSTRCGARRWRWRARSSGARRRWRRASGGRKSATACSSTTTRTRRTARSPRAYSVRPTPDARVSAPLTWDEVDDVRARRLHAGDDAGALRGGRRSSRRRSTSTPCSLDALLELSARQEREGLGDAPWPPHYRKQPGEPPRVQPSRRRTPKHPLIEIGRAQQKDDALAGSSAGRRAIPRPPRISQPADVLVDAMRGRFHTWTRIRVNLQHVPEALRPAAGSARSRRRHARRLEQRQRCRPAAPKTFSSS